MSVFIGGLRGAVPCGYSVLMDKYGLKWPDATDPVAVELALYDQEKLRQMSAGRCLSRWEHLRNAMKLVFPERVFVWHRWMDDVGEEWAERTCLVVWGAGGTTKSGMIGALSYMELLVAPRDTLVVMVTAPLEKHWDRCFSKLVMWRGAADKRYQVGRLIKSPKPQLLTVEGHEGSRRGVVCISPDPGDDGAAMAKKVGAHARRTFLAVDEGQGCGDAVLGIGKNLFMGSEKKMEVIIGNPTAWSNALGKASLPLSIDRKEIAEKEPDRWETARTWDERPGVCLVLDGKRAPTHDSPAEAKRLAGIMIQPADIALIEKMPGGRNSLDYWSQVRGRIPPAGAVQTVISELDLESSGSQGAVTFAGNVRRYVGGDMSYGGDKCPLYLVGVGQVAGLGVVPCVIGRKHLTVDVTKPDRSMQLAIQFRDTLMDWKVSDLSNVALDASGQQGHMVDTFERVCHEAGMTGRIYRVRSDAAISERRVSYGRKDFAKDRYADRASELVMNPVECVLQRALFGIDEDVAYQLYSRKIDEGSLDGGKLKVQKKKEWREQNEGKSPDELDALAVCVAMLLERKIIVLGKDTRAVDDPGEGLEDWMRPRANRGNATVQRRRRVTAMLRP